MSLQEESHDDIIGRREDECPTTPTPTTTKKLTVKNDMDDTDTITASSCCSSSRGQQQQEQGEEGGESVPMHRLSNSQTLNGTSSPSSLGTSVKKRWSHMGGEIPSLFRDIAGDHYQRNSFKSVHSETVPLDTTQRHRPSVTYARQLSDSQLNTTTTTKPPSSSSISSSSNHQSKIIPSKLNAKWPPVRVLKDTTTRLSLQRCPQGLVPPQSVKTRRSSFEPVIPAKDMSVIHDAIRSVGKSKLGKKKKNTSSRRRANMRIRWGGPTVFLIERIRDRIDEMRIEFHPNLLTDERFVTSLGKDSRPVRPSRVPSLERFATTTDEVDSGWYDHQEEDKVHSRPDVWVTPVSSSSSTTSSSADPVARSWRVKRIWNAPEFDQNEKEHTVNDADLMDTVKSLLGVTEHQEEACQGKWVFHEGVQGGETDTTTPWGEDGAGRGSNSTPPVEVEEETPNGVGKWVFHEGGQREETNDGMPWGKVGPSHLTSPSSPVHDAHAADGTIQDSQEAGAAATTKDPKTLRGVDDEEEYFSKLWGAAWIYDVGGEIEESENSDLWLDEAEILNGLGSVMDEEHTKSQSIVSIPEEEMSSSKVLSHKHKSRAFERPDVWVSPADGERRFVSRRSWKIKAVDLTKDSEHSVLTDMTAETTEADEDPTYYEDKTEGAEEDAEEDDLTPVVVGPRRKSDPLSSEDMTERTEDGEEDDLTPTMVQSPTPQKNHLATIRYPHTVGGTPEAKKNKNKVSASIFDLLNPPEWKLMTWSDP